MEMDMVDNKSLSTTKRRILENKNVLMQLLAMRRKELKLNQSKLAHAAQSSQKQISCYEKNLQVPSIIKFFEICDVLELNITITRREDHALLYDLSREGEK